MTTSLNLTSNMMLDTDPLAFSDIDMRIYVSDTSQFSINDKITLSGITEKEIVVRNIVADDFGNVTNYFNILTGTQYMTVNADNNMSIDASLPDDIEDTYVDMTIGFNGFTGDTKTQWLFDTRNYIWSFVDQTDSSGNLIKRLFTLTENVHAVTAASSTLPLQNQIREDLTITTFDIDPYGNVIRISSPLDFFNIADLRWTTLVPLGPPPQSMPAIYQVLVTGHVVGEGLFPPATPTSIINTMRFIEVVQNQFRGLFFQLLTPTTNSNFALRYAQFGAYQTNVRIVAPETTIVTTSGQVGNISLNFLNSTHRMYLTSADIERDLGIYDPLTTTTTDIPLSQFFYVSLNHLYSPKLFTYLDPLLSGMLLITVYENAISDVTITYHHYGGVPIKLLNTQYPVGFTSISGFAYIKNIVTNSYITVELGRIGLLSTKFGGDTIYLGLISDTVLAYLQPNQYVLDLEQDFSNIVMVRMVNSIFPITQKVFIDGLSGGKRNNKFYWQNADDGDTVYTVDIGSGNYGPAELKIAFEAAVQQVLRVVDKVVTTQKNVITLDVDEITDKVTFSNFNFYEPGYIVTFVKQIRLSDINICGTITSSNETPPIFPLTDLGDLYYLYPSGKYFTFFPNADLNALCNAIRIKIYQPTNNVLVGDTVTIKDSLNYGIIPASYINQTHIITRAALNDYDILLYNVNVDLSLNLITGGDAIKIYTQNNFRIRFDYSDTFGNELGFRDVGESTSITPYNYVITNDVIYDGEDPSIVLQSVAASSTTNLSTYDVTKVSIRGGLSLKGPPYLLILCKELTYPKSVGVIKDYFYKIDLCGKLDTYVYNSFVDSALFYNTPIVRVNTLSIDILAPDGSYYDFNGINHSFVLEIVTYDPVPENTQILQN